MEAVNNGLIYGLEFQCRALASLESDDDAVRFVVGTQGPRASNQVLTCRLNICISRRLFFDICFSLSCKKHSYNALKLCIGLIKYFLRDFAHIL
jgi:hypothetical protein